MSQIHTKASDFDHPEAALARSIAASSDAMIVLLGYVENVAFGEPPDDAFYARRLAERAAQAHDAAMLIGQLARVQMQWAQSIPDDDARARRLAALATFEESGQVEIELANVLATAARRLGARDPDLAREGFGLANAESLTSRRISLLNRRRNALD